MFLDVSHWEQISFLAQCQNATGQEGLCRNYITELGQAIMEKKKIYIYIRTHIHTHTYIHNENSRTNLEDHISGFQEYILQQYADSKIKSPNDHSSDYSNQICISAHTGIYIHIKHIDIIETLNWAPRTEGQSCSVKHV